MSELNITPVTQDPFVWRKYDDTYRGYLDGDDLTVVALFTPLDSGFKLICAFALDEEDGQIYASRGAAQLAASGQLSAWIKRNTPVLQRLLPAAPRPNKLLVAGVLFDQCGPDNLNLTVISREMPITEAEVIKAARANARQQHPRARTKGAVFLRLN